MTITWDNQLAGKMFILAHVLEVPVHDRMVLFSARGTVQGEQMLDPNLSPQCSSFASSKGEDKEETGVPPPMSRAHLQWLETLYWALPPPGRRGLSHWHVDLCGTAAKQEQTKQKSMLMFPALTCCHMNHSTLFPLLTHQFTLQHWKAWLPASTIPLLIVQFQCKCLTGQNCLYWLAMRYYFTN